MTLAPSLAKLSGLVGEENTAPYLVKTPVNYCPVSIIEDRGASPDELTE